MKEVKSLAQAMRERAFFLTQRQTKEYLEYSWGSTDEVVAALLEMADVIDSWSGEYLSKELTYEENNRRQNALTHFQPPMTMEERISAVRKN